MRRITLLLMAFCMPFFLNAQTNFSEVSEEQGLDLSYGVPVAISGGVTFCDFDNDGWDDLTFTTVQGDSLHFFKNYSGVFTEINVPALFDSTESLGINWVDVDNDGELDFFKCSLREAPRLYKNIGDFTFVDVTDASGIDRPFSDAAQGCWGDVDNDGFLDLFIITRIDSLHSYLYMNNGDFTFDNVSVEAGVVDTSDYSNCAGFIDYDNDNDLDIFIANDKYWMRNRLLQNDGTGHFTEVSETALVADSIDAMSVSVGDYNNDSYFDIYVTNTDLGNYFLKNNGDGTFSDIAAANGTIMESIGWGAQWIDGDNNSWQDLYVSGMLTDPAGSLPSAYYYYDHETETFSIPEGIGFEGDTLISLSNAMGDINNDGFADLVIHNMAPDSVSMYENSANDNNWLKVNTEGTVSNYNGIGAVIKISTSMGDRYNFTMLGEAYNAQNSFTEFFGLDTMTMVDTLTVKWPSGHIDSLYDVAANQTLNIVEGQSIDIAAAVSTESTFLCEGETLTLTAEGEGSEYLWSTGEITPSIIVDEEGVYWVEVSNAYGFSETSASVNVELSEISYSFFSSPDTCGIGNGKMQIYDMSENIVSWVWATGEVTDVATGLDAGVCSIVIMDSVGCEHLSAGIVYSIDGPEISFYATGVSCYGDEDGSITAFVSGADPFSYLWDTGGDLDVINDLSVGWYALEVTDDNGCIDIDSVFIDEPELLESTAYSSSDYPELENGIAWVVATGGVEAYSYFWNDPMSQTTDTAWGLGEGMWTVWVVDDNGCTDSVSVSIEEFLSLEGELSDGGAVLVFPNPSNGSFTVVVDNESESIETVTVRDVDGRVVEVFDGGLKRKLEVVDSGLSTGVYFVIVKTNTKRYMNKIMIH